MEIGVFCEHGDGTTCAIKLEDVKVEWRKTSQRGTSWCSPLT